MGRKAAEPIYMRISPLLIVSTLAASSAAFAGIPLAQAHAATSTDLFVSPSGSNSASGATAQTPLKSIQDALNRVVPGDTIHLAPGVYNEDLITKVSGTAALPITIEGTDTGLDPAGRAGTVLYGAGRIISVNNSYYHLQGFTINGEEAVPQSAYPTTLAADASFKNDEQGTIVDSTMIFIGAADSAHGVTGTVINDMYLSDAGGDCVRMRGDASYNTISNTTIQWCGLFGKYAGDSEYTYHNGEGVYIGTSPKSTTQSTAAHDNSHNNVVENSVIHTFGSECFDVKENAHSNTFADNICGDNDEPLADEGSNVELRGYNNTVIGNTISGSLGYGLKMASDSTSDVQGHNFVEGNTFSDDGGTALDNMQTTAQSLVCGNTFAVSPYLSGNAVGTATTACPQA
jgi:hypothetical protein